MIEAHVTPETGRSFFEGAFSLLDRHSPARVDFRNAERAPLLIVAGEADHIVPASTVRRNHHAYRAIADRDRSPNVPEPHPLAHRG